MLLAAGRGSRLGPLAAELPKCLLRVGGVPLLDQQLDAFAEAGITDVTVVAGFEAEQVVAHIAGRCRIVRNDAWASTNSLASLHLAAPHVRGHDFIFQNADVLYPAELVARFAEAPRENACLIDPLAPFQPDEYRVELDAGRIARYSRDVPSERSAGRSAQLVRIGARDCTNFLDRIAELAAGAGALGFPNQAYEVLIRGSGLWPVFTAGLPWWEVDTAEDYARCVAAYEGESDPASNVLQPSIAQRVRDLIRERRLPSRWAWVPAIMPRAMAHPIRTAAHVRAFRRGRLSHDGLDLAVNGIPFLAVLLDEARRDDIELMLLWGTLLGCVRDGNLIHDDHDLDLGIMARDVAKLGKLRSGMLARGFRVRIENEEKLSLVHPRHPRLHLDLDVVRPHPDGWAIVNADADPRRRFRYIFAPAVFRDLRRARLADQLDVTIPGDAEGFLAAVYGNWRVPRGKLHYLYGPINVEVELLP